MHADQPRVHRVPTQYDDGVDGGHPRRPQQPDHHHHVLHLLTPFSSPDLETHRARPLLPGEFRNFSGHSTDAAGVSLHANLKRHIDASFPVAQLRHLSLPACVTLVGAATFIGPTVIASYWPVSPALAVATRTALPEPAAGRAASHQPSPGQSVAPVLHPLIGAESSAALRRSGAIPALHLRRTLSPPPPAPLPRAAALAAAYAKAIYTWSNEESVLQWFSSFSLLVTPGWWRAFTSADPAPPSRATTVVVQRVLAAEAPPGEVGAEVLFTIAPAAGVLSWSTSSSGEWVWLVSSHS